MPTTKNILIIDDSIINVKILSNILCDEYNVITAENGEKGLKALKANYKNISGIMLDIVMPVMDGFEFLETVKKVEEYKNIPIIVSTGNNDKENEIKVLELGAWDFVSKPYDAKIIKFRLKNAITRSQLTAFNQLKYMAEFDILTDIYNKTKFFQTTQNMVIENPEKTFALIRFDVDKFSLFNSFFGAIEGDKLLEFIAKNLKVLSAHNDNFTFGRIEVDVFALCIPFLENKDITSFINQIERAVSNYDVDFNIKLIFGVSIIKNLEFSVENMFDKAVMASQSVKEKHLTNFAFYTDEMGIAIQKEQEFINEMRPALKSGQFSIYLQPKVDIKTNKVVGAEALVRWNHPKKGLIPPSEFIPVFERNGYIIELDNFIWEEVCKLLQNYSKTSKKLFPISVNVSRVNLYSENLVENLRYLTDKYNVSKKLLQLEITESAYVDNSNIIRQQVDLLQKSGFVILMDDFGSGYSSLNILKDLKLDILKIDMKFFEKSENYGRGEIIIASVVDMAKQLNLPTIAEGVETAEQVDFLRKIGCDYVQGYYFSKPMPVCEFEEKYKV